MNRVFHRFHFWEHGTNREAGKISPVGSKFETIACNTWLDFVQWSMMVGVKY